MRASRLEPGDGPVTTRRPAPTGVGLPRLTISRNASAAIDSWAWGLADGSLHLAQLPGALFTFWNVAFASGRASRDHEVKALTAEANRLWLRCFGEKEREQFLLNRLDQAATLADRPDVDDVLDEAWRIYLAGLHNLRDPLRIRDTDLGRKVA